MATINIKIYDDEQDGVKAAQIETSFDPPMVGTDDDATMAQDVARRLLEYLVRITGGGAYALEYEDGGSEAGTIESGEMRQL